MWRCEWGGCCTVFLFLLILLWTSTEINSFGTANWWAYLLIVRNSGIINFNPLNAELNPICHLLILLGDLTLMGIVHYKYIPIYIQQDATLHSLLISGNCSTCFGWHFHSSSGAHTTVSTASGICHIVTAICRYRGRVGTGLSVLWVGGFSCDIEIGNLIIWTKNRIN
jgi:hypothetical protein